MLLLPCGILEVFYASSGRLGCLKCVGVISCLQVILTFSGLISATVLLSSFLKTETFYFSWSFALGWLAVIVAAAQESSYRLRLAVALLITASNLFLLITLVSDYWINARNGILYLGLWKGCNANVCYSQTGLCK
ncbi:hypothetical protein XELAEV_18036320mg [Xenopus laevis]|uniref:Uncharacterized protein n=1 Tax=Xenopus laevis TaxID=8355 RepID=A0A974HCX5_XENLA|nr:hypothetical protein XELAEV_18036320mg [Xenopus laevis]